MSDSENVSRRTERRFAAFGPSGAVLILVLLTLNLVHANWNAPFLGYDDGDHLKQATDDTFESVVNTTKFQTYLPIGFLSLRLDRALFGPPFSEKIFTSVGENGIGHPRDPATFFAPSRWSTGSRISNALHHLLAGVLLGVLLLRLGASRGVAFLVAAAWTGHPMACESVCWISERKNILSALFGFAAMIAATSRPGETRSVWCRFVWLPLFYFLSVLSKPTGVGFLPILVALECIELFKASRVDHPIRMGAARWLDLAATLALPILLTGWAVWINMRIHDVYFVEPPGGTIWTAILTDAEIFFRYVANIFVPKNLSFFYGIAPALSVLDWRVWVYGLAWVTLFAALLLLTRGASRIRVALGLLWFLAALGPTSNLAPIPYWMQDRYAYIASAGLLLAVIECLSYLSQRWKQTLLPSAAGAGFLALLALAAFSRSADYADVKTLFIDAAQKEPLSGMAQFNAWKIHFEKDGDPASAKESAENLQRIYFYYSRTILCPDRANFMEEMDLRVKTANTSLQHGQPAAARTCLDGWLPPPHLQMHDPSKLYTAGFLKKYYDPITLAQGYGAMAQIRMLEGRTDTPAENPQILALQNKACADALTFADKAIALADSLIGQYHGMSPTDVPDWKFLYVNLSGKILSDKATIEIKLNDPKSAQEHAAEAGRRWAAVPRSSLYFTQSQQLLTGVSQQK